MAPPFGGVLYEFCGKAVPFVILAFVCLFDGFLMILIMRPMKAKQVKDFGFFRCKTNLSRFQVIFKIFVVTQDTFAYIYTSSTTKDMLDLKEHLSGVF